MTIEFHLNQRLMKVYVYVLFALFVVASVTTMITASNKAGALLVVLAVGAYAGARLVISKVI